MRSAWMRVAGILFATAWGGNGFTPLLVMYRRSDEVTELTATLLLGAYVVGIVPGLLIGGPLSDRWGRRPLALPAPYVAALGSLILAFGELSPWVLLPGRILSGLALGLAMAAGAAWVKELSGPRFDPLADDGAGARRASLATTAGLGAGATIAAALAQYGPLPGSVPYLVSAAISVALGVVARGAPETHPAAASTSGRSRSLLADLRVPVHQRRRFFAVVVPVAPWVFGTATVAYAILPGILAPHVSGFEVGFAGLLCLVALGCGLGAQPLVRRIYSPGSGRALICALTTGIAGVAVAALAVVSASIAITVLAAAVLGAGYGLLMVSGLLEIQRIAGPDDLAGLTGLYYSMTYVGFFLPAALAFASRWFDYPSMFCALIVIGFLTLGLVVFHSRRAGVPRSEYVGR